MQALWSVERPATLALGRMIPPEELEAWLEKSNADSAEVRHLTPWTEPPPSVRV